MPIFSFHLAKTSLWTTTRALLWPPTARSVPGLRQAECMTVMGLGSPILSRDRWQLRHLAVFASWEDQRALDAFLTGTKLGESLSKGWHVRLEFLRRWGSVAEFDELPAGAEVESSTTVVAVTLARMKLSQVPRFLRWGKPVERQVRDHPGATLALAAMSPPRTISTFSVWHSQRDMLNMVRGRDSGVGAERHAAAMVERKRKDFHYEFTTLRFKPIAEYGAWEGRNNIVPLALPASSGCGTLPMQGD